MTHPSAAKNPQILLGPAAAYLQRGWALVPNLSGSSKGCYLRGWPRLRLNLDQLAVELDRELKGIGVLLGSPSGGLVDVDLDHAAAVAAADAILPVTGLVSGRTGRPRTHRWYRAVGARSLVCKHTELGVLVELRGTGLHTVLPPSRHPDGFYFWDQDGEPAEVPARELERLVGQVGAAAFLRAQGWRLDDAVAFARCPSLDLIETWEAGNQDCPDFRGWLGLPAKPGVVKAPTKSGVGRSGASTYTLAILEAVGGVVGAARLLGLELHEGHQVCPWHRSRGRRALQVTGPLWRCHAGCGAGGAIHLAAKHLGLSYREGRNALAERVGIDWRSYAPPRHGGVKRPEPAGARGVAL